MSGLVLKGREQQAENALRRIRGSSYDETAMRKEMDISYDNGLEMAMAKSVSLIDVFRGTQRVGYDSKIHV